MKGAELGVYATLLILTAGLALHAWKGEEPASKEGVVLFDAGAAGLETVTWDGKRNVATLEIEGKGDDAAVWITAGRKERLKVEPPELPTPPAAAGDDDDSAADGAADGSADGAAVEEVEVGPETPAEPEYGEAKTSSFPGSKQATTLVGRLSPLTALRQFDGLTDEDLDGMGLASPEGSITLAGGSKTLTLEIGGKAYGGSDTYVREPGSSTAYLLSSKDLGPLRSASSSLRDRDLLGFEPTDAAAAKIAAPGGAPVDAAHAGRHDKDNSFWTAPGGEERDAVLDGFMKAALAIKASTYLSDEDRPADADLEPVVALAFADERGRPLGKLELARRADEERSKEDDVVYEYFARSHRLRGQWAKVSRSAAEELGDALEGVAGRTASEVTPVD